MSESGSPIFRPANTRDFRRQLEAEIQGMTPCIHMDTSRDQYYALVSAIDSCDEEQIHQVIAKYPNLLYFLLRSTGHHGMWVRSKPQISPGTFDGGKGKIPDFLVCAKNSDGPSWYIVELKRPDHLFAKNDATAPTASAISFLNQLIGYVRFTNEYRSSLRETLQVPDLVGPVKGILILGEEKELVESDPKRVLRRYWNDSLSDIEIASYSRLVRGVEDYLGLRSS